MYSKQLLRNTSLPAALLGVLWAPNALGDWSVLPGSSSVTMYATKQGAWFDGSFAEFTAAVDFDPAAPAEGSIAGTVRTDSIDTGDEQNDAYVLRYLEVENYPEAQFVSTAIRKGTDSYEADGELTLLGLTKPVTLYFSFETTSASSADAMRATFVGQMTIDRFDFGIASDIDTTQAGRQVVVQIELDLEL
jgi:polyisoprenoid-binding protein YceI